MENQSKKYTLKTTESGDIFFTPDTKPIDLTDNSTALFERQKKLESDIDLLIREFNRDTGLLPKAINLQVTDLGMRRFKLKKVIADVPLSY